MEETLDKGYSKTDADEPVIMNGKDCAKALTDELLNRSEALKANGVVPRLAVLRLGERPQDVSYERGLLKRAEAAGVDVKQYILDENAGASKIKALIEAINGDEDIHGLIMFRPLADKEAEKMAEACIDISKDVDCMNIGSLSGVYTDSGLGFAPCTAQAVMELIKYYNIETKGKNAVVIGRSQVIGRPAAMMLLNADATVTICHSKTKGLREVCQNADILVAAIGRACMIDESYLRKGQTIIDVGINTDANGKLCGDVSEEAKQSMAAAYTPVPGGVGSVTTAVLMKHVIEAAEKKAGK